MSRLEGNHQTKIKQWNVLIAGRGTQEEGEGPLPLKRMLRSFLVNKDFYIVKVMSKKFPEVGKNL